MKDCPVCGFENPDNAAVCQNCQSDFFAGNQQKTEFYKEEKPVFTPGSIISDRYEIVQELGRGGMGIVYLVKDSKLRDRLTALKITHPEIISDPEARQRFKDEAILCLDLLHPNIVRVYNLDEWHKCLYITMEYIEGKTLRQVMDERKDSGSHFSLEETAKITEPLLDALTYAHQTTIHRDIKPENIIILGSFPDIRIKILDFGIAKVMSASRFTRTAQSMGTAYYMSPEQMQGEKYIDHRSDLYSVGMVLYELLTGMIAAGRFKLPCEIVKDLPPDIDCIIEKALSPVPEGRYSSAAQLKQTLLLLPKKAAEEIAAKELNNTVMKLLSKAAFDQAQEKIKQSGLSTNTFLEKVREIKEKYLIHMDKGNSLLSVGDFETAREQFKCALGICPDAEGPYIGIKKVTDAVKIERKKETQLREQEATMELSAKELNNTVMELLSKAAFDQAREEIKQSGLSANTFLEKVREIEEQYLIHMDKGNSLLSAGDFETAREQFNSALGICPGAEGPYIGIKKAADAGTDRDDEIIYENAVMGILLAGKDLAHERPDLDRLRKRLNLSLKGCMEIEDVCLKYYGLKVPPAVDSEFNKKGSNLSEKEKLGKECSKDIKECTRALNSRKGTLQYLKGVYEKRLHLWQKAADLELPSGYYLLGRCYEESLGFEKDMSQALKYFRKAADQGHTIAQTNLGVKYYNGKGVTQDYAEAARWYRKAAEQNYAPAQVEVGRMYLNGKGVSLDYDEAMRWFHKAAEQSNVLSQQLLGIMYQDGKGVSKDYAEAIKWYRKGTKQGYAKSQLNLGFMYYFGEGVTKDYTEAASWFHKAADQKDAYAQLFLGLCYQDGLGVKTNKDLAKKFFMKAADQGLEEAKEELEKSKMKFKKNNSSCFITTAICKNFDLPDDCRELNLMRQFRDTYMMETARRQKDVNHYYKVAPGIVDRIEKSPEAGKVWENLCEKFLLPAVDQLEQGDTEIAYNTYKTMMEQLEKQWLPG